MKRLVLIAAIVAGFYWKLVLTDQYTWLQSSDLAYQWLPWMVFEASEVQAGRLPLWDPNHWVGQPLLAQAQPGAANPLHWVLFSLPLSHGWIRQLYLHWYFVIIHILAAWAAYKLARDLGCNPGPSVFGGCVYALSGWMGTVDWPHILCGAIPAPLVLMYLLRLRRGGSPLRCGVLGGFFLGLSWLSGHHQIPLFLSLMAVTILLAQRAIVAGAAFFVVAFSTGALQILPVLEYARLAVRWVNLANPVGWGMKVPIEVHNTYRFAPADLLGILVPGLWTHASPFLGVCALTFVVLGLLTAHRRREVRILVLVGLGGLLFAMAGYSYLHGWLYSMVPFVDKARNPSWAILLFHLAASALAAVGLDNWVRRQDDGWGPRLGRLVVLMGALGFATLLVNSLLSGFLTSGDGRPTGIALSALLVGACFFWKDLSPRLASALVLCLFLFEAGLVNTAMWSNVHDTRQPDYLAQTRQLSDVADFLIRQPGYPRIDIDRDVVPVNFGDFYGVPQLNGYLSGLTTNVYRLETHTPAVQNLLGVRYAILKGQTETFPELVFTGRSGVKVYRNPAAWSRAWVEFEPSSPCVAAPQPAEITLYHPNEVRLRVQPRCSGTVVLSDTFYPGWRAEVDGRPAMIREVHGALRGVAAAAGTHEVVFRYRPTSVLIGALLTLAGSVLAFTVAWGARSRT